MCVLKRRVTTPNLPVEAPRFGRTRACYASRVSGRVEEPPRQSGGVKRRYLCQEERSFQRKPLFEAALRTAPERRHRTGNALEKAEWPAVLVNMRSRRHRRPHPDLRGRQEQQRPEARRVLLIGPSSLWDPLSSWATWKERRTIRPMSMLRSESISPAEHDVDASEQQLHFHSGEFADPFCQQRLVDCDNL